MQRFLVVNVTKREFLDPEKFGDGPGLLDFGSAGSGVMLGLAVLLAQGCNKGLKELQSDHPLIGSWSGDRIAIAGDQDTAIFTELKGSEFRLLPIGPTLHEVATELYLDLSEAVIAVISEEPYERRALENKGVAKARTKKGA